MAPGLTRHRSLAALGVVALLLTAGVGTSSSRAGGADAKILRIGTTFYVDTLNPFVGIETNDRRPTRWSSRSWSSTGPGLKLEGDWAKSWTTSSDGLEWTFHLIPGGKWSDKVPLTADDAVWTIETVLKYKAGATSYLAGALLGVSKAVGAGSQHAGDHLQQAGRAGAGQPGAAVHPAQARVGEVHRATTARR